MNNELQHHGIKGQRWGVRRFQNKNGTLTPEGKKRYDDNGPSKKEVKKQVKSMQKSNTAPHKHPVVDAILENAYPLAASTFISNMGVATGKKSVAWVAGMASWYYVGGTIGSAYINKKENREAAREKLRK